jgi:hypothetical protein
MFNELEAIRSRLLAYIESAYHLSDSHLVRLRRELLEQPEVFCHAPFIESSARYKFGHSYRDPARSQRTAGVLGIRSRWWRHFSESV